MWLSDVDQSDFLECSCCARVHRVHVGVLADLWSVIREPALKIFVMLLAPPPPRRHRPRTDLFILISLGLSARSSSLGDEDRLFASQMILTGTRVNNMTNWCSSSQSMIGFNNSTRHRTIPTNAWYPRSVGMVVLLR